MSDMKLIVAGASGRMGLSLIKAIHQSEGVSVVGALEREGAPAIGQDAGELAGLGKIGVVVTSDAKALMTQADGIIDFTIPGATVQLAKLSAEAGIVQIIGTTGCSSEDEAALHQAANKAVIVKSGNMSLGVSLLSILVEQAAKALDGSAFDIEIVEMHHKHKIDAPSGTALMLGEAAATGRDIDLASNSVHSRDGHTGPRETGIIGFSSLRGGSVVGDHKVVFAGEGERIELSHIAQDRMNFAFGAVKAALWAKNKKPGYYSMRDVLGFGN